MHRKRRKSHVYDIESAVARGMALLDKYHPEKGGWRKYINLETLNNWDPAHSILGQLFGNDHTLLEKIHIPTKNRWSLLIECGFIPNVSLDGTCTVENARKRAGKLTEIWKRKIRESLE